MARGFHGKLKTLWPLALAGAILLGATACVFVWVRGWMLESAVTATRQAAATRSALDDSLLSSELQKFRLLPLVLTDYPAVTRALNADTAVRRRLLDETLELLAARTNAADIYVLRNDGTTIAASNWRRPTSFVGKTYGFRPYFTQAQRFGESEVFALGTVSKRAGLYLARRTLDGRGVVVVKVEFDALEKTWARGAGATFVEDGDGVIILSSRPEWRLRATRPIPPATLRRLVRARLFGDRSPPPLAPLLRLPGPGVRFARDAAGAPYEMIERPAPGPGWRLVRIEPMGPALAAATVQARVWALGFSVALLVALGLGLRAREKRALARTAQRSLREEVIRRTAELRGANTRLREQSIERERDEARLRLAQEELAQANRLATLGQISAGVAHEVNQPLAAMRTFAENASVMLDRGDVAGPRRNLGRIIELTGRIDQITSELRLFARRETPFSTVRVDAAIDGALLLMGDRLRRGAVTVRRSPPTTGLEVFVDRVRLEQVLVNLIQNAADALENRPDPCLRLEVIVENDLIFLRVQDNGAGVPDAVRDTLFTPFATHKPQGLGLGLTIARDIMRGFGGDLVYAPAKTGAAFVIELKRSSC